MIYGLWGDPRFAGTATLVFISLIALSAGVFAFRTRSPSLKTAWASLKSWLFVAPLIFATFALPHPWPLLFVTWMGILTAKSFFQLVGMYHRSWFVWTTYVFIVAQGYLVYAECPARLYDLSPMIFLFVVSLIPILRNSAAHMIQYMGLSLLAFIFWGWSYMHMARLLAFEGGALMVIYLYLLAEVSENTSWVASRLFGRYKPFGRISNKTTLQGMFVAFGFTMLTAWGLRSLLPDKSDQFWIAAGLVAAIFGRMGDLVINVIRRDLGVKNTGVFIIGRDGVLTRVDKLLVIGPMYYYLFIYLQSPGAL